MFSFLTVKLKSLVSHSVQVSKSNDRMISPLVGLTGDSDVGVVMRLFEKLEFTLSEDILQGNGSKQLSYFMTGLSNDS